MQDIKGGERERELNKVRKTEEEGKKKYGKDGKKEHKN